MSIKDYIQQYYGQIMYEVVDLYSKGKRKDEIARKFKLSTPTISMIIAELKIDSFCLGSKNEPYYQNEDDYCRTPIKVTYKDLSDQEKLIYKSKLILDE
jgi:hypothetical protein